MSVKQICEANKEINNTNNFQNEMEVDSCPKEPCSSQKNAQNDSKNHTAKAPIFHFCGRKLSNYEERNAARSLTTMRRRNIAAKDEDLTSLCMQMEDMNANKGFKPCETERKKRILQRLRALVDSYKNGKNSEED